MTPFKLRRLDLITASILGATIALGLNLWFNIVGKPVTVDEYMWLARLHEPAIRAGEWIARALLPAIGYPWNVRFAVASAYAILVGGWMLGVLVMILVGRMAKSLIAPKLHESSPPTDGHIRT